MIIYRANPASFPSICLNIFDFLNSLGSSKYVDGHKATTYYIEKSGLEVPMGFTFRGDFQANTIYTTGLADCEALIGLGIEKNSFIKEVVFSHVWGGNPDYIDIEQFSPLIGHEKFLFIIETANPNLKSNYLARHIKSQLHIKNEIFIYFNGHNYLPGRTFGINKSGYIGTIDVIDHPSRPYMSRNIHKNPGMQLYEPKTTTNPGKTIWYV